MTSLPNRRFRHIARVLGDPSVVVGLLVIASVGLAQLISGPSASLIAVAIWLSIPALVVIVLSAAAPPVTYVPRSILSAEGVNLGRFFRGGFGLVVAGLVGSMSAIAVQADLTTGAARTSQIGQFLVIIGTGILAIGTIFAIWRYSFLLHLAGSSERRAAVRRASAWLVIAVARRPLLRSLHGPYFRRWQWFLSDGAVLWVAVVSVSFAVPIDGLLISQAITSVNAA